MEQLPREILKVCSHKKSVRECSQQLCHFSFPEKLESVQMSFNELLNKRWYMYTMESSSAMKRSKLLIHAATWVNPQGNRLSEQTQSPKCDPIYITFFSFFLKLFIYLFIYFWLCWVFVSVRGLPLAAASGGHSSSRCAGLTIVAFHCGAQAPDAQAQ